MSWLLLYIPLGVLGLLRWTSWVIRQIPASMYRPVVNDHSEPMTIVVPVYQEDPVAFRRALVSWLTNGVHAIICVIDRTDVTSQRIAGEYPGVQVVVTDVPGKRDALRRGWEAATTPLVALVDSDTVWAGDCARHISMPFADPAVGGVAARQNVTDPQTVWQRLNDIYLDYRYAHELASQSTAGRAVSCLSGRTAVYRRHLLLECSQRFMNETFWGVPCLSGDDKRLTTLVLEAGYATVLQRTARVWSQFPPDARTFLKQRLRWSRNTWRSDLRALSRSWVWRHPFLAFWMIDKAVASFTLLVAPGYLILAIANRHFVMVGILLGWWMVSRSAKLLSHLERYPNHLFTMMPIYIAMSFVMALVKIFALLTVRTQRWLTRDVRVSSKLKTIVRTAPEPQPDGVRFHARPKRATRNPVLAHGARPTTTSAAGSDPASGSGLGSAHTSASVPGPAHTSGSATASAPASGPAHTSASALGPAHTSGSATASTPDSGSGSGSGSAGPATLRLMTHEKRSEEPS